MGGATAFLTEYAPPGKRAYYSSWIQSSIGFAVLLGAATGTFVTASLDAQSLHSWGWRLPFLIGILVGPVGYYIRSQIDETPAFSAAQAQAKDNSPLKEVFERYPREIGIPCVIGTHTGPGILGVAGLRTDVLGPV